MEPYVTREILLSGTSYKDVYRKAIMIYNKIKSKSKRRPYVRSKYFNNEKVFLDYFWDHIRSKSFKDRTRRLKYYLCCLDLIRNSKTHPNINTHSKESNEKLYRFSGTTLNNNIFFVQIKTNRKNQKFLISVFPK